MNKIPKIIHYCWFGDNPLPDIASKCIESWKKYCPDYKIIRWDESNFDVNENQYVSEAILSKKWAFATDYVRLKVVHEYGGIYLDIDVELLKPLDDLLMYSGFMGFESKKNIATGLGFGASKHNRLVYEVMNDYKDLSFISEDGSLDLMPCPERNSKILNKHGLILNNSKQIIDDVLFLPMDYFNPTDYESMRLSISENTYSIHHYNGSWVSEEQRKYHGKLVKYNKRVGKRLALILAGVDHNISEHGYWRTIRKSLGKLKSVITR